MSNQSTPTPSTPTPQNNINVSLGPSSNGTATFALVCSLLGVCFPFMLLFGAIFGGVAWYQTTKSGQQGRGVAIAATLISTCFLLLWLSIIMVMVNV